MSQDGLQSAGVSLVITQSGLSFLPRHPQICFQCLGGYWGVVLSIASDASMGVVTLFLLNVTRLPYVLTMLYSMEFGECCFLPCFVPQFFNFALRLYLLYSHISQSTSCICKVTSTSACIICIIHEDGME